MNPNQLIACMSAACLALMAALMVAGGASALPLALLGIGAVVMMTMCLIADL